MDEASFPQNPASVPQMRFGKIDDLVSRVAVGVDAARKFLFSQQHEEGFWCGELEADTTLESDYILLHTLLGTGDHRRFEKAARYILRLGYLRWRAFEYLGLGKGLFRPQAGRFQG